MKLVHKIRCKCLNRLFSKVNEINEKVKNIVFSNIYYYVRSICRFLFQFKFKSIYFNKLIF